MKDQTIIIVGGASGLGLTTAKLMVENGAAKIGLIDRNAELLASSAETLRGLGVEVATSVADISRAESAHKGFNDVAGKLGRVHALVNSAAIYPRKPILEITDEDWDLENAINVKGTYHMMVAAVLHMRQFVDVPHVTGRIVNVTSVDAFKAHPQNAHYAATKAAVVSLTKSFAQECAKDQILVNSVAPAGFATDRAKELGFLPELAKASALGRAAEPVEMAQWIVMMASGRNTYATGENVVVSGGYIYV
ncbi:SDR family NAD(P)-dependent oxidoreductase [Brucella haematophila]|uniref:SDR family oxidoreductase n=1 Tax=Brucella haematophila TaxID=419474 RepID=A0ABX1DM27_9HYPH|nr:SDR family oxidoreductase [Brucella haematophila]MBA8820446.1 NAD(P)-dependent dehydrogenase (short-subunit alcohol dehydrogenase family) [Ochrobactrum sp. P6BSIII]MBA8837522.1 NAD(P)-dependent dehydrogenase (short-subunit alcohol dehydrogenase family) [Ochrobactrum sp. RH2CCR150]MDH7788296.1 3-oxoacyl-[acyl-carrier protein] reductase [Ochrobactrum sp. 19YEA23]OOL16933.1 oxidoreductase [Ochrobactrum sp. P6BS-III]NKC04020.1 SDR family oxidoreductase [Brucella haematophila]